MNPFEKIQVLYDESSKASRESNVGRFRILMEILLLKYLNGIGVTDYFVGKLYRPELNMKDKFSFLSNAKYDKMLEAINPQRLRTITTNKLYEKTLLSSLGLPTPRYLGHLHPTRGRDWRGNPLQTIDDLRALLQRDNSPCCVLKPVDSYGGHGIKFLYGDAHEKEPGDGAWTISDHNEIKDSKFFNTWGYVCEEKVKQHETLDRLNPSSLNTLRIWITKQPEYKVLGAFIRMAAANIPVDNVTSGGLFAHVDVATGKITSPAIEQTFPVKYYKEHPVTGVEVETVSIPFWEDALRVCRELSFYYIGLNLIAFDIAISENGPVCIESNCGDPRGQFKIDFGFGALLEKGPTRNPNGGRRV